MKQYLHKRSSWIVTLLMLLIASTAQTVSAATTACPAQYLNGVAPDIQKASLKAKARELCYENFAVMHSGISRTPIWSAEHLTRESIQDAKELKGRAAFHHEDNLPADERAELTDYVRSGFDRGHMVPSADMPNRSARQQCFTLANMIPQNHKLNTILWEGIESSLRTLVLNTGELYVITGPLYQGANITRLNGRVLVPTHVYKLVFDPKKNRGAAYYVKNEDSDELQILSISELEKLAGINFFPKLSASAKQLKLELPKPKPYRSRSNY